MPSIGYTIDNNQIHAIAGFGLLMIVSVFTIFGTWKRPRDPNLNITDSFITDTNFTLITTDAEYDDTLNVILTKCLSEHSRLDYLSSSEEKQLLQGNDYDIQNGTSHLNKSLCTDSLSPGLCMHYLLIAFIKCMESLDVKPQLIEPSILYCLLPSAKRYNVLTRGFKPSEVKGLRNVITFGISERDAKILDQTSSRLKLIKSGFRIWRFPKQMTSKPEHHLPEETLQYILKKRDILFHLIIFYQRNTYLWHPGLNASGMHLQNMLYKDDGAYDKFATSPLDLDSGPTAQVLLPSDSRSFLLAFMSSKFLECYSTLLNTSSIISSAVNNKTEAVKEIKKVLELHMVNFWLWAKTLKGWYESCNIAQYSSDLELAIVLKDVRGYNFTGLFAGSACQEVKQDFNLSLDTNVEMKCHSINIRLSLMHESKNEFWFAYSDGQNSYRQMFPIFDFCSGDVSGIRVNLPCETNKILQPEF